ncbi:hypothetical protein HPP92_003609 [Vanilla planifolia]|uniref:Uncharacterized protein n=1 Tax=Vanilla planifolia TaxID=51239 RepID=A0A835S7U4_VANPL|nr:hypothetical protein HPP92_003609 [Vanilla planifolia]
MNGSLVNNPLAFGCDDPSLQIFLPTQPDSRTVHAGLGEQSKLTSVFEDGWISLAPAADGVQTAATRECRPNSRNHLFLHENWPESMENDSGSPLLSLNRQHELKATLNGQKPDASFSPFPSAKVYEIQIYVYT